jgi:hypothetical protein
MNNTLYVGWQNTITQSWHTVGKLSFDGDFYSFVYTKGILKCLNEFTLFSGMNDINKKYLSKAPFPFVHNRLLPKRRPEFEEFISWLDLNNKDISPLEELAFSGGVKGTDNLEFFSFPQKLGNNKFVFKFFVRGIRHLSDCSIERIKSLVQDEKIYLMPDPQNKYDKNAVALRVNNPALLIGYCPKYFSKDFFDLSVNPSCISTINAKVLKVNKNAPLQYRLSIEIIAEWPKGYKLLGQDDFEPIRT